MAWLLLIGAALLEIVWATALERSDGFTRPWPSVLGVTAAALSFVLLSFALRQLPMGTAYAVWVGIGAVGVAAVGILVLGESVAPLRLACLGLILAGVIGLRLLTE
ncbi:DMT family transporter [Nonomuraea jiangxiensis]|uniref:Quaternary ammonium compound-resistance protein SugE n=1 Tax=Nonomuraea jiangxiensis TaxID=633440 RepID=A0A1G9I9N1_9ACTN|nr:multidrug efflux SMR transporter [Nonomuraea jiangxiensis]SDL21948.1 quaternary ammonium compound-resistance protein SugE [Nonomuraea jiangxiensis]